RRQARCPLRSGVRSRWRIGRLRWTNVGRDFTVSVAIADLNRPKEWPVREIQSDQHLFVRAAAKKSHHPRVIRILEPLKRAAPQSAARSSQSNHLFVEPRELAPSLCNRPRDWHLFI